MVYTLTTERPDAVKFVLEVDVPEDVPEWDAERELGRILRYWAGNLRHFDLQPGDGSAIYDSDYREVGSWQITSAGTQL